MLNFNDLHNDINRSWPDRVQAKFLEAIGYYEKDGGIEEAYKHSNAYIELSYIKSANEDYKRGVVIRDIRTGGSDSEYSVNIQMNYGKYTSKGEDISAQVKQYADDRINELNEHAKYLSKATTEYPIEWKVMVTQCNDKGSELDVHIYGETQIPVSDIEQGNFELGDLSKLLVGGLTLVQHPNHHDSYLGLNRLGYCNDSWSKPEIN